MSEDKPWSVPVRIDDVRSDGTHVKLSADAATRDRVARSAGVVELPELVAELDLTRRGRHGVAVAGTVSAKVRQTCVVTLEPLESEVRETVELVFAPPRDDRSAIDISAAGGDDGPEPLEGGSIDLGAIAIEFLVLGIDPYPRKPGAVFDVPAGPEPEAHPFAALSALKKSTNS
jgi:uncharacterized metal-binding protein YceD (DUF177 family)